MLFIIFLNLLLEFHCIISGFGSNTGVFGSANQSGGIFSKPGGFGAVTTTTASGFSFNTTTSANPFGATQPKPFGSK